MYCQADSKTLRTNYDDIYDNDDQNEGYKVPVANCNSSKVLGRVQANAFNLITQGSGLGALFKQENWAEQSSEDKAYAFQQLGRTTGQIFVDLTAFKATLVVPAK